MRLLESSAVLRGLMAAIILLEGCAYDSNKEDREVTNRNLRGATKILERIRQQYAPDPHLSFFELGLEWAGAEFVIAGEVSDGEAKAAVLREFKNRRWKIRDQIRVLPE